MPPTVIDIRAGQLRFLTETVAAAAGHGRPGFDGRILTAAEARPTASGRRS